MRCLKFIFLLAMVIISVLAESVEVKPLYNDDEDFLSPENAEPTPVYNDDEDFLSPENAEPTPVYNDDEDFLSPENADPTSLRGVSRFLAQRTRVSSMKCNTYPRICRVKGSPGPDCCKKRCVNIAKDRLNCGKCGNKCKFLEICCKGKCVNPLKDKKHCGGCNNKCNKGSKCTYGMCSYAN